MKAILLIYYYTDIFIIILYFRPESMTSDEPLRLLEETLEDQPSESMVDAVGPIEANVTTE